MVFNSESRRLPSGYGFVLRPSVLSAALESSSIEIDASFIRSHSSILLDARFWPPTPNVPYERLYIRSGTVTSREVAEFRRRAEVESLPRFINWISGILAADIRSPLRRNEQYFRLPERRSEGIRG